MSKSKYWHKIILKCIWARPEICKYFHAGQLGLFYGFNNKNKKKHLAQLCAEIKCWVCVVSIVSIHWVISSALWHITQQLNPSALGRFPLSPDIWMDHTIISPALKPYAQWLFCLQTSLTGKISNHHGESRCFSFPAFLFFPFFPPPQSSNTDACVQGQYWFLNHLTRAE